MARAKNFLKRLGTSYLLTFVNTLWTLVSLPVALHHLAPDEYPLWLLVIPRGGISGMLLCSLACSLLLTFPYFTHRVAKLIGKPTRVVVIEWFRP